MTKQRVLTNIVEVERAGGTAEVLSELTSYWALVRGTYVEHYFGRTFRSVGCPDGCKTPDGDSCDHPTPYAREEIAGDATHGNGLCHPCSGFKTPPGWGGSSDVPTRSGLKAVRR